MTRVCFVKIMIIPGLHFHCVSFAHSYHLISFLTFTDEIDKRISIFLICIYLFDSHYVELSVCSLQVNKPRHLRYHLRTDKWIRRVNCHTYIIHGTKDWLIPISQSESLQEINPHKITLIRIHGGGHNNLPSFPEYHNFIRDILKY